MRWKKRMKMREKKRENRKVLMTMETMAMANTAKYCDKKKEEGHKEEEEQDDAEADGDNGDYSKI